MTDTSTFVPDAAWLDPDGKPYTIHVLMGLILAELQPIGRNRENEEQHFKFRGIDDTKDALNPLLSKYGVFYLPDVIERVAERRTTRGGATMYEVNLHTRYTFYGPAGDFVVGSAWGEGTDMGDKSTNKAMTGGEKQMLFQAFSIATQEAANDDQDRTTPDETVPSIQCRTCLNEDGRSERFPDPKKGDPEPYRQHMVDHHGYQRLEDGRVAKPDTEPAATTPQDEPAVPPATEPAATPEAATEPVETPDPVSSPEPDVEPTPEPEPEPAGNPEISESELVFVDKLKKSEAAKQLRDLGEPTTGTVAELRDRLKARLRGTPPTEPTVDESEAPADDEAQPEPADDPRGPASIYCPEEGCDVFPFHTQDEYEAHWLAEHDPDREMPPVSTDEGGAVPPPEFLEDLRKAISSLRGARARAYGAYRREAKLPKIEEMSYEQAIAAFDFIEALPAES